MAEKRFNILFLEDNVLSSHLTVSALARELPEAKFHTAASVGKAESLVAAQDFDLFVLDVVLPDGNGIDFLSGLKRESQPAPRAIFMTANALPEYRRKAEKSGAVRFFEKPVKIKEFAEVIREVLGAVVDKEGRASFEGLLTALTPMDLVQLKCLAASATGIEFTAGTDRRGTVYFQNGNVVHAAVGELQGEAAFFEIMGWKRGRLREVALPDKTPLTILSPWADLVMRAAQHMDEAVQE
ncbi:MAG: response regulator [Verrucomicrobia bacterium]|nr:response regulator [Verrucomicrobiota bacterium]